MSKEKRRQFVNRRKRLWKQDPKCRICGIKTILQDGTIKIIKGLDKNILERLATMDHIYPRNHPLRHTITRGARTRLLCHKCNQELAKIQAKIYPGHPVKS